MAQKKYIVPESDIENVANAIRQSAKMKKKLVFPNEFISIIKRLGESRGSMVQPKSISFTPMKTAQSQSVTPDEGYDGLSVVNISVGAIAVQSKSVTYTPTETVQSQNVTPDDEYDGLSQVNISIGAIPGNYVGSSVPRRNASNVSISGQNVSVTSGYYENTAQKAIPEGTVTAPSNISATGALLGASTNQITLSKSAVAITPDVTTPGYIDHGTEGNSSVSLTATIQTKSATTYYPSTSDQTISASQYLTGAQTVKAVAISSNLSPENIKSGVTITVGDSVNASRITSVTGTYGSVGNQNGSVRFIDYDGTVVESYTAQEFLALNALPANPSHTGLTAQGWNWSLNDAKTYVTKHGALNVGQMYTTSDGKTRIYIYIDPVTPASKRNFSVRFTSSVANNVTINWGDGTTETKGSTSATDYPHTYSGTGEFVITLTVNSGTISLVGTGNSTTSGYSIYGTRAYTNALLRGRVRRVEIGNNVLALGQSYFWNCYALSSITIPSTVTSLGQYLFEYCYSLKSAIIPTGVTSISSTDFFYCSSMKYIVMPNSVTGTMGSSFAYYCYSLISATIPDGITSASNTNIFSSSFTLSNLVLSEKITSIGQGFLASCYSLTNIIIPSAVTSIGNSAFASCYNLGEIHFLPTTPPTVSNSNAWTNLQASCVIYVPKGSLSAYTTATNYPSSATYTYVGE